MSCVDQSTGEAGWSLRSWSTWALSPYRHGPCGRGPFQRGVSGPLCILLVELEISCLESVAGIYPLTKCGQRTTITCSTYALVTGGAEAPDPFGVDACDVFVCFAAVLISKLRLLMSHEITPLSKRVLVLACTSAPYVPITCHEESHDFHRRRHVTMHPISQDRSSMIGRTQCSVSLGKCVEQN
jgi:hypothetical protein